MIVVVILRADDDPRVYDVHTGKDVTSRCKSIEILPHRQGRATMLRHRDGKPYLVESRVQIQATTLLGRELARPVVELATEEALVVEISALGPWTRRGWVRREGAA